MAAITFLIIYLLCFVSFLVLNSNMHARDSIIYKTRRIYMCVKD